VTGDNDVLVLGSFQGIPIIRVEEALKRLGLAMDTGHGPTRSARWSPYGRFIAYRNDGRVARIWDAATAEAITDYAKLLSGRQLSASGMMSGIPGPELAELHRSLLARHPELFSPATARD